MKRFSRWLLFLLLAFLTMIAILGNLSSVRAQEGSKFFLPILMKQGPLYSIVGPDGGSVATVAVDPEDGEIVYAGTWGNGVYKSTDAGQTWETSNSGLWGPYIYEIAIDPNDGDHLLASVYKFGIYQSFNAGETWYPTQGWPEDSVVYTIEFDPGNPKLVYAGIRTPTIYQSPEDPVYPGFVYKSIDGGQSWVNQSEGLANDYVYDLALDPNDPNVIYAAMHVSGVYKSEDGAKTWEKKWNNLQGYDVRAVTVHPEDSTVYIGQWDGQGISYSINGGDHWYKVSSTVLDQLYVYELQVDPNHPSTIYLSTSKGVYQCENLNLDTECQQIAHPNLFVYDLELDINGPVDKNGRTKRMYTGLNLHGLYKSTSTGENFFGSYAGIKANVVVSVLNDPQHPSVLYISIYGKGVFKSTDHGETWLPLTTGLPSQYINQLIFRPGDTNVIYAATQDRGIFRSDNAGDSWISSTIDLSRSNPIQDYPVSSNGEFQFDHPFAYAWMDPIDVEELSQSGNDSKASRATAAAQKIQTIAIDPSMPQRMIAGTDGNGVLKSDDFGNTWKETFLWSDQVYDSFVDPSQGPYSFFVGLFNHAVRASDKDRVIWFEVNNGFHYEADVYQLAIARSGVYYAGTESGIYKTSDAGKNWKRVGLSDILATDLFINPEIPNEIWAVTGEGIYRSRDAGASWYSAGFGNFNNNFLTIAQGYGEYPLYFGMSGGNVYRLDPAYE